MSERNIKFVMLTNGMEILGSIMKDDGEITIMKPVRLQMTQEGLGMTPLSPFTEHNNVTINEKHVLWVSEPVEDIYNDYNKAFWGGLVIPSSSLVV